MQITDSSKSSLKSASNIKVKNDL